MYRARVRAPRPQRERGAARWAGGARRAVGSGYRLYGHDSGAPTFLCFRLGWARLADVAGGGWARLHAGGEAEGAPVGHAPYKGESGRWKSAAHKLLGISSAHVPCMRPCTLTRGHGPCRVLSHVVMGCADMRGA